MTRFAPNVLSNAGGPRTGDGGRSGLPAGQGCGSIFSFPTTFLMENLLVLALAEIRGPLRGHVRKYVGMCYNDDADLPVTGCPLPRLMVHRPQSLL